MTVYKYVPDRGERCGGGSDRAVQGTDAEVELDAAERQQEAAGVHDPAVVSITKANYTRLFTDKFLKRSDVCSGEYKQYCK